MYNTNKSSLLKKQDVKHKKNLLRHNEYYGMQPIFDDLYKQSQNNSNFKHLYDLITSDDNILLAYRNIKRNHGSKTPGTNRKTIKHWENVSIDKLIHYVKNRFTNYQPQKIRRVEIPKSNGKTRPLGIPCIEDRIIQQCIKQILEPICEAKFHQHSYGFRPNRSTENAVAYLYKKINIDKCYFMVDIDIKGFFDNVDHSKLIKQLWNIGIQDKKVLSILSKMLKAEVEGEGLSQNGVPQGGILSPLLSNIVLNELDWWISNQWETFKTDYQYTTNFSKYAMLRRNSNLKEIYIVRYADDFKIACKDIQTAKKIFIAVKHWLKDRLKLDISPDKSKITDVRKTNTEFLGFRIKAYNKRNKWIIKSHLTNKAIDHAKKTLKDQIKHMATNRNPIEVYMFNRIVAGLQNYYKIATEISKDFSSLGYKLSSCLTTTLKSILTKTGSKTKEYYIRYAKYGGKDIFVLKNALYPINKIKTKPPFLHNQHISNYTTKGRNLIHTKLGFLNVEFIEYLRKNPDRNKSVEFNDNRLSLYSAQWGRCAITKLPLNMSMEVHHIKPLSKGGDDRYKNLVLLAYDAHKLIHAVDSVIIAKYLTLLNLKQDSINKVNKYRRILGNEII